MYLLINNSTETNDLMIPEMILKEDYKYRFSIT